MSVHPFLPMHYSSSSPDPNSFMMHSPQLEVDYVIQNPLPSPSHQSWTTAPAPAAGIDPQSIQANADDLYNLPDDFLSQLDSAGTELDYIATLDMPSSSSTPFAGSYGIFPHGQGWKIWTSWQFVNGKEKNGIPKGSGGEQKLRLLVIVSDEESDPTKCDKENSRVIRSWLHAIHNSLIPSK